MLASTTVCIVVIYFLFLYSFRPGWGGVGVIGPWDGRHFSRVTSGVRFCVVGRALWSCPATRAVLCVGRFLRGYLADKYVGRLSLGSALCPPPPLLMLFHGVGGGSWDNQQFGRATFGARFCSVGRALRSCPATRAVLCVGRFLRGCLADNSVVRPPPSLCLCFFSSLFKFLSF